MADRTVPGTVGGDMDHPNENASAAALGPLGPPGERDMSRITAREMRAIVAELEKVKDDHRRGLRIPQLFGQCEEENDTARPSAAEGESVTSSFQAEQLRAWQQGTEALEERLRQSLESILAITHAEDPQRHEKAARLAKKKARLLRGMESIVEAERENEERREWELSLLDSPRGRERLKWIQNQERAHKIRYVHTSQKDADIVLAQQMAEEGVLW